MEQQIQQAVEIALSATTSADLKQQALQFINEVKSTQEGYTTCLELLLQSSQSGQILNEGLKFFIFQVIDENIEKLSPEQIYNLDNQLFKYLETVVAQSTVDTCKNEPAYLKNKLCEIFGHLFCHVYHLLNVDFFKNLLMLSQRLKLAGSDYYLRILISVHFEVGDKFISRDKQTLDRNTVLKDLIRERDMAALVSSWKETLAQAKDTAILDNVLKVIGYYIDWMDISLFVTDGFLNMIYDYLNHSELRHRASLTLIEVVSKKMKPGNKLELINMIDLATVVGSLKGDNVDFFEDMASLSNQIGLELCLVLENDPSLFQQVSLQFLKLWPIVLELLAHEYDDVSQQVFAFILQYLFIAKKFTPLASSDLLTTVLKTIIQKMKYDSDADAFDDDDQFDEIRQKLKTFQDSIATINPQLYLEIVPATIETSLFSNMSGAGDSGWIPIELGLYELSNFADSLKNNLINLPKSEISSSKPYQAVQDFLIKIINNFNLINHPKNQLAFFELIIRHFSTKTFSNTTNTSLEDLVIKILELFSDYGLFNGVQSVRLRCWYLFLRFVNATKPKLNSFFLENLLVKLLPLLVVKAELPTRDEDDDLVENGIFENQLYLFEVLGMLVALSDTSGPQEAAKFVDILFQPLFGGLETCISYDNSKNNPLIPLQAHHLLMAIATIVKGLDTQAPGQAEALKNNGDLVVKIGNAAQVVLFTFEAFNKFEAVREASRFAFARFVPILDIQCSTHVSKLVSMFLGTGDLKIVELGDFAGFVGQLVHVFRGSEEMFQLLNDLITPMFNKMYELLAINDENFPDLVREKYGLKRSLLTFVSTLVLNNSFSLLLTETNKAIFPKVLSSFVEYARDLEDPPTTKAAITQFGNVITVLGCNNGKISDAKDKFRATVGAIEGMDEYLMQSTVEMCFEIPFQLSKFDVRDAQIRNVAGELSSLLKIYQSKLIQQEFVTFLANYLAKMGLEQSMANEFCSKLVDLDAKAFKKFYVTFLGEFKK